MPAPAAASTRALDEHARPTVKVASDNAKTDQAKPDIAKPDKPGKSPASVTTQSGKPSVPSARLSSYAEEAAELLAGLTASRRRRKSDAGEPTSDPASAEASERAVSTGQTKQPTD
jgi:hypothetical protein